MRASSLTARASRCCRLQSSGVEALFGEGLNRHLASHSCVGALDYVKTKLGKHNATEDAAELSADGQQGDQFANMGVTLLQTACCLACD